MEPMKKENLDIGRVYFTNQGPLEYAGSLNGYAYFRSRERKASECKMIQSKIYPEIKRGTILRTQNGILKFLGFDQDNNSYVFMTRESVLYYLKLDDFKNMRVSK